MPAMSTTIPSTRRLSEVARHVVIPDGIVTTGWAAVEAQCREFGDEFDEWQRGAGQIMLGKRVDGIYAATIGGITLSIPRQVAKTFLVGRIVFAMCVLFPGLKVLWTAHRTRTATNTFKSLQGFAKRKKVEPYIADIRVTNGEQEFRFTNGSVIMFGSRESGFGRGFDEVDVEVFDESQILTEKALEDMVAATNQSRHPHGALLFYMGTPPRPVDPGEVFTTRRNEALSGESEDAVYIECSADPDADPDDREQWAIANPSFPHRTPLRSMQRLRKNLPHVDSWRREALGIWDAGAAMSEIPNWDELRYVDGESVGIVTSPAWSLAVSASDRGVQWGSIGKAGRTADGLLHIEWVEHRKGTRWIVPACVKHFAENGGLPLRVHKGGPESALIADLIAAGVKVCEVSGVEVAQATGALIDAASDSDDTAPTLRHLGQPSLDRAVSLAVLRTGPDGAARWDAKKTSVEITPLLACTVALGGVPQAVYVEPSFYALEDFLTDD